MICYDMEFPESARILMLKGAELVIVPTSCDMNRIRTGLLQSRAMENMVGVALANYVGEPGKPGQSVAFDGMVYLKNGSLRDNQVVSSGESQGVYLANFDLEAMREYRGRETWGNAFRKPTRYHCLTSTVVNQPFVRKGTRR
jgi:predicted amidohydrolase